MPTITMRNFLKSLPLPFNQLSVETRRVLSDANPKRCIEHLQKEIDRLNKDRDKLNTCIQMFKRIKTQ